MSSEPPPSTGPTTPIAPGSGKYVPTRKVGAGALAGALSVLVVACLNTYALPKDRPITPEIASAITTVLTFLVGYFIHEPD